QASSSMAPSPSWLIPSAQLYPPSCVPGGGGFAGAMPFPPTEELPVFEIDPVLMIPHVPGPTIEEPEKSQSLPSTVRPPVVMTGPRVEIAALGVKLTTCDGEISATTSAP